MRHQPSDFLQSFEMQDLDPAAFDHASHIRAAYEMLEKYPFMEATAKYATNIEAMAIKAGASQKFNVTLTIAFMSIIAGRMDSGGYDSFEDFIAGNSDLMSRDLLAQWYSVDRLKSDRARKIFLMPDLVQ